MPFAGGRIESLVGSAGMADSSELARPGRIDAMLVSMVAVDSGLVLSKS